MGKYDDIINLPHHTSPKRPRMSMIDRAAQFSPLCGDCCDFKLYIKED